MKTYYVLTVVTVPRFLWDVARLRRPCVIGIAPAVPLANGFLRHLLDRLRRYRLAVSVPEDAPELLPHADYSAYRRVCNPRSAIEAWMEKTLGLTAADDCLGPRAVAYKHALENRILDWAFLSVSINHILQTDPDASVAGVSEFLSELRGVALGPGTACVPIHAARKSAAWENRSILLFAACAALVLSVFRLRPFAGKPEKFSAGIDVHSTNWEPEEVYWREVDGVPGTRLVLACRNKRIAKDLRKAGLPYRFQSMEEGSFGVRAWCHAVRECIDASRGLLKMLPYLPGELTWSIARTLFIEVRVRAFFNRFPCRNFIGFDDYNVEHILRTIVLREQGGLSLGIRHGMPSTPPVITQIRYVSYDRYYFMGMAVARMYEDTWPKDMAVVPIGPWRFSRAEHHELLERRGQVKDIVYFFSASVPLQERASMEFVIDIANSFPDRSVHLKPKNRKALKHCRAVLTELTDSLPGNLKIREGRAYSLLCECKYIISDPSTLIVEALHYRKWAFFSRLSSEWGEVFFDRFPELRIQSASDFVDRVQRIEREGIVENPFHDTGLLAPPDRYEWDFLRAEMGLAPAETVYPPLPVAEEPVIGVGE